MTGQDDKNKLLEMLLEKCDALYQENARLKAREKEIEAESKQTESYKNKIAELENKVSKVTQDLEFLRRKFWGKSSEKFIPEDPRQRKLDFEGLDLLPQEEALATSAAQEIAEYKEKRVLVKVKSQPVRQVLPENIERREEHIYPEGIDNENWVELSPEITEILEHEPAKCYVRRIIRHVYALKQSSEGESTVLTPSLPALPIPKSYAGASLLAEMMINKYVNHLPFYRQIQMFKQLGITLPPSTVNDWFKDTADLLRPLYYRLKELVLNSDYIQVDESTIPIVREEKHKTVKGYIWMVRSVMQDLVFFHYDHGSRSQKTALELLKDFKGALQTDGYEVYAMYENKKGVLPLGCWAHARRYFETALKEDKARAEYALAQIGMLYDVERRADEENLSYEERADLRERLSYPIMVAFEKWIVAEYSKVLPKGPIGKALKYTYGIYHKLTRFHLDGRYRIDNNLAENAIRPIAVGRRNYLFCGNDSAAEDAAVMYSLLGCCKAIDVNFRDWMVYVLSRIHDYDTDYSKDLAELLPYNWKTHLKTTTL